MPLPNAPQDSPGALSPQRSVAAWPLQAWLGLALAAAIVAGAAWVATSSAAWRGGGAWWLALGGLLLGVAVVALAAETSRHAARAYQSGLRAAATEDRRGHGGHWRALFDASGEALLLADAQQSVRAATAPALKLLALEPPQVVGQPLSAVLPGTLPAGSEPGQIELSLPSHTSSTLVVQRLPGDAVPQGFEVWRLTDTSHERAAAARIRELAHFDSLTGLPNRALFNDRLRRAMERARRSKQTMALMFLDLDRFKLVNDSLGHAAGDALLSHVAKRLTDCLRGVDTVLRRPPDEHTVSRLGGDEFTVIVERIGGADDAAMIARRILEALAVPVLIGEEEILVSASIGIALYPTDDVDQDGLLRHTDMAMYRSKSLGRNTFSFFSDDLNSAVQARVSLESALRRAVERDEFVLHYQPKADLRTGEIVGMEALMRWNCPGRGLVPPDRFIPVLEDTGLILPAGAWVIRRALAELDRWNQAGLPPITVAVNLSVRQLRHQLLASMIQDTLEQYRIDPRRLELELTESLLMEDTEATRAVLTSFGHMGVRLAIDDFGTGHSSLSYLRRFKVDTLKIDRSFVSETPSDAEACAIARAIVAMGQSMQMRLVAEGVETVEQADFLRDLGCHEVQGYLLTRPLPMSQLMDWFQGYERRRRQQRPGLFAQDAEVLRGELITLEQPVEAAQPA